MVIKLYYDLMSQPSRVLYILLKTIKCEFEPKYVNLRKAEHYSYEFTNVNRMQRVPVIDHDGFVLTESIAIMKYLSRENFIPDALYPKDSKLQARVEEFLEWHHVGLRLHCAMYFRVAYMNPILTGSKLDDKTIENYKRRMLTALEDLHTKWLGRGTEYIAGDTITVADLVAACELEQPRECSRI
ncbi:LOW QUALITY PROTEIN: glutathione S-transferase theta-1-like [Manduca sexta]|uniref:LOW QUALITY PROTEIN: glutathione S-transferase theta-1-like n=1 Tax=Manduca sexta TaxID=7130 RepID=UPI00188E377F|nr:LOW QUALITY PROTEIN: glutathione S-transferase theta-1-like [Manduca sexta]